MKKGMSFALLIGIIMVLSLYLVSAVSCIDEDADGFGIIVWPDCINTTEVDCNDNDPNINPGMEEVGNGIDDNCDGQIDEGIVLQCTDSDLDSYNASQEDTFFCPGGDCCSSAEDVDCDDSMALVNPGMEEICGDGLDNDCDPSTEDDCDGDGGSQNYGFPTGCSPKDAYWVDCDGDAVSTVNEGDSVYLVVWTDRCDADSLVDFTITEDDTAGDIDSLTEQYYLNIPENVNVWAAGWLAAWLDDGTVDPGPEYSFNAKVMTPDEGNFDITSSELTVNQCPPENPDCGEECALAGGFMSIGGRSARGGGGSSNISYVEPCVPQWDCSTAVWSECNPSTGKVTRDTSLCVYTGRGDDECQANSLPSLPIQKACASSDMEQKASSYAQKRKGAGVEDECGDGICGDSEDSYDCPEDCAKKASFPWWLVIVLAVVLALVIGGVLYYFKMRKKSAGAKAAAKKLPFESENDLKAVQNYIKMSKEKGVPEPKIKEMLKKSDWTDAQIEYAFAQMGGKKHASGAKPGNNAASKK